GHRLAVCQGYTQITAKRPANKPGVLSQQRPVQPQFLSALVNHGLTRSALRQLGLNGIARERAQQNEDQRRRPPEGRRRRSHSVRKNPLESTRHCPPHGTVTLFRMGNHPYESKVKFCTPRLLFRLT